MSLSTESCGEKSGKWGGGGCSGEESKDVAVVCREEEGQYQPRTHCSAWKRECN